MFSLRILTVFVALWSVSTQNVVFKDDSTDAASYGADNAPSTGVRSGPLDDSIVVEAPGAGGDTNTRFFGLLGGGGSGLLGGGYGPIGGGIGAGYPVGGVGGVGGTKPGRCPGILGLGIGQPEGGHYGGVGAGYGAGYPVGYGGGYNAYKPNYGGPGAYGGYPSASYGGAYPGVGYPGAIGGYPAVGGYGYNGGFGGFRSGEKDGETNDEGHDATSIVVSRITRQADESAVEGEAKEVSGRHYAGSVDNGGAVNEDARFFGGLFGKNCFYDYHCPGQLKCCAGGLLGGKATCQQPAIFG